jgi:hypothetical protein
MKSYEYIKFYRYSSSKILSALWTGFAISWERLLQPPYEVINRDGRGAGPPKARGAKKERPVGIGGSQPMQNDQTYFFSDIFLNFYNIIKIII